MKRILLALVFVVPGCVPVVVPDEGTRNDDPFGQLNPEDDSRPPVIPPGTYTGRDYCETAARSPGVWSDVGVVTPARQYTFDDSQQWIVQGVAVAVGDVLTQRTGGGDLVRSVNWITVSDNAYIVEGDVFVFLDAAALSVPILMTGTFFQTFQLTGDDTLHVVDQSTFSTDDGSIFTSVTCDAVFTR